MQRSGIIFATLAVLIICLPFPLLIKPSYGSVSTYPSYAKVGAYAFYAGDGGFIAFLSGVSGNISYTITDVYPNGTMNLLVNANLSLGTEVTNNVSTVVENLTDYVFAPRILPAVPPQDLNGSEINFQNVSFTFVANNGQYTVAAGTFNATEYQASANGTTLTFWFDRPSGLAIEMLESGSYFQLVTSNIAVPLAVQSSFQSYLPYILVFVTGWTAAGLLFYGVRRYYIKKSERQFKNEIQINRKYKRKSEAKPGGR
jgi:hypothetical protein